MPAMANITVKKADNVTDVIYVAATPSAGDKVPAIWTQNAYSGIQGNRPRLELVAMPNAAGTQRRVEFKYSYPVTYTDSTTSLVKKLASVDIKGSVFLNAELSTTEWNEAFAQLGNLLVSSLVRSSVQEGFAPT